MSFIVWLLLIPLAGIAVFPIVATAAPSAPDRGYGAARALGVFLVALVDWLLVVQGALSGTRATGWIAVTVCVGVGGAFAFYRRFDWRSLRPHVIRTEAVYWGVLVFFLAFRSLQPEIYWGEKPMDFTLLNYFIRLQTLPPEDPWAVGHTMQYYYFGPYLVALLHKLSGIESGYGYNFAVATLPALLAAALYSSITWISRRPFVGVTGALFVVLAGNLEAFRLLVSREQPFGFDLFWASTRVIPAAMASEYPLFSFLFADLHAHVIALPLTAVLIFFGIGFIVDKKTNWVQIVLYAGALATLVLLNTWDVIAYGVLSVVWYLRRPRWRELSWWLAPIAIAIIGFFVTYPFLGTLISGGSSVFLERYTFTRPDGIFRYLGQFLVPLAVLGGLGLPKKGWLVRGGAMFIPIAIGLGFAVSGVKDLPWATLLVTGMLVGVSGGLRPIAGTLVLGMAVLIVVTEFIVVGDRMNTLFKLYYPLWLLGGVATAGSFAKIFSYVRRSLRTLRASDLPEKLRRSGVAFLLTVPILIAGVSMSLDTAIMATYRRIAGPRPTLDGLAYLDTFRADESAVVNWMRTNLKGLPTVVEAVGPSYGSYTRISMLTGLPTLLGWEHHVKQRGVSSEMIDERTRDVDRIYRSNDVQEIYRLLRKYRADYFVVGAVERFRYQINSTEKFRRHPKLFAPVFKSGEESLFAVVPPAEEETL